MRARADKLALLHIASLDQPIERTLHGRAAAAQRRRNRALAQETPAELVGVHTEKAEDVKIATFKPFVGIGPGGRYRVSPIGHSAAPSVSGS